jgi:hypothetical protein
MAIEKALNRAPAGLGFEDDLFPGEDVEVVVEEEPDPEDFLEAEAMDDEFDEEIDSDFSRNLVEELDAKVVDALATELLEDFEDDINSRKDWIQTYVDGLELLGMKIEERSEPWQDACGVYHPLLSEALVKFQAETMMSTFPAQGPVRTEIIGKETREKREAAQRVEEDMNYQLTDVMVEYRPEHERLLWGLGLAGNAFKKVYMDPNLGRQTAIFIPAEDVVVPYGASNLQTCERVTHIMRKTPNEVKKLQKAGFYSAEVDLGEPEDSFDEVEKKIAEQQGFRASADDRHKLLEMHVDCIVEGDDEVEDDGIARPYIVTIDKHSKKTLAIRRNWQPDDVNFRKRNHLVHYAYIPGFGFYAFGLIHLIGAFAKSSTSLLRQLVDAGTLSNLPGGFKTKGLRIKGDDTPVGPGEFRDVDVASGTMRDNIMPLPYKEPSMVLSALLGTIVEEGRRFAGAADLKLSDMSGQAPVGTTLAILERTLKTMSAVQARIHYAMKQEFKLLKDIIRDFTPDDYDYEPDEGEASVKQSDYDMVEVIPVSDPNASTMAQKVVQYQAVLQMAQMAPQIYNLPELHRQMIEGMGIQHADKLVPVEDDQKPKDPVSENMDALRGEPLKAFIYQDHDAHIAVHTAAMQDPKIMQAMGQNPNAQMLMGALQAHLMEHIAFAYRKQIEDEAGVPYPPPNAVMDEDTETNISRLAAVAAKQALGKNQQAAAAQQAQQTAQDPIVQMQQQEMEIKRREVEVKEKKFIADAAAQADKIDLERERLEAQERIAGMQVGAKVAEAKDALEAKQEADGMRMGVEMAQDLMDRDREEKAADKPKAKTTGD